MNIFIAGHHIVSSYGSGSDLNFEKIVSGKSSVDQIDDDTLSEDLFFGSRIDPKEVGISFKPQYTKLENLMLHSIEEACKEAGIELSHANTQLILSTTKGNVDALDENSEWEAERAYLHELSAQLGQYFQCPNEPLIISNACISGGCAIELGKDLIQCKRAEHVVVCGGDLLSEFVLSGFKSFHAVSDERCAPYDEGRKGINLGEAVASIVLSASLSSSIELLAASTSNDANHISGPSRTGEGLYLAIQNSLKQAKLTAKDINYISAHGTATLYNDKMESIAFERSDLLDAPVNSYKGYFGHTLGAAGVIESILACLCLENNQLIQSYGYDQHGVSRPITVIKASHKSPLKYILKTGSGFGGGNNALIFGKQ